MIIAEVELVKAGPGDAELIHRMKYEAFLPIYERYHDDEISPTKEPIDKVIRQLSSEDTDYCLIRFCGKIVGGIRIVFAGTEEGKRIYRIAPIFILPAYQNRGIGYAALQAAFARHPDADIWRLDTNGQEPGNCHLYEKCGFIRTGREKIVNERITLVDYQKERRRGRHIAVIPLLRCIVTLCSLFGT